MRRFILLLLLVPLLLPACGQKEEEAQASLLRERDREFVGTTLGDMKSAVRLVLFSSREECEYCDLTESFLEDIASLAEGVTVEILSLENDSGRAAELGVDKAPGIAILGAGDHGIRYYGLPTGYEFETFVEAIRQVGDDDSRLMPETVEALASLAGPVSLTVFSTKTWPYCPKSARVAYGMAIGSDMIRTEIVDADEFSDMARRFSVGPVPKTVINYKEEIIGAAPESWVLEKVLTAPAP